MPQRFATSVAPDVQITLFMWHLRMTESPFHVECTLEAQNLYGNQIYPPDQWSPQLFNHPLLVHLYIAANMIGYVGIVSESHHYPPLSSLCRTICIGHYVLSTWLFFRVLIHTKHMFEKMPQAHCYAWAHGEIKRWCSPTPLQHTTDFLYSQLNQLIGYPWHAVVSFLLQLSLSFLTMARYSR